MSIFCYIIFFYFNAVAGNGGEYWGFDGQTPPWQAAEESFNAGEYRFLAFDLDSELRGRQRGFFNVYRCDIHPSGPYGNVRFNVIDSKHGIDSVRLATEFSRDYNNMLASMLSFEQKFWCERTNQR